MCKIRMQKTVFSGFNSSRSYNNSGCEINCWSIHSEQNPDIKNRSPLSSHVPYGGRNAFTASGEKKVSSLTAQTRTTHISDYNLVEQAERSISPPYKCEADVWLAAGFERKDEDEASWNDRSCAKCRPSRQLECIYIFSERRRRSSAVNP